MGYAHRRTDPPRLAAMRGRGRGALGTADVRGTLGESDGVGALGAITALAAAADAILASLPAGSGVNPITPAMNAAAGSVNVVDTQYGGSRAAPFYWVNPIRDASGLIDWTGSDSAQFVNGLSSAQLLAAQILLAGGDKSWSADYNPPNQTYLDQAAAANLNPATVQTNYNAPALQPTAGNVALDQTGNPLVNTYPANDVRNFPGYTQAQLDEYVRTHGGFLPGDSRGGTGGTVLSPESAQGAVDAVSAAGGDPSQWTEVRDSATGGTVAIVRSGSSGLEMIPTTSRTSNVVNTVTGFIDKAAGTLQNVATEVQKVGNAIKGGAAGAQAGYNVTDFKPWLIGGAVVVGLLLLNADKGRS